MKSPDAGATNKSAIFNNAARKQRMRFVSIAALIAAALSLAFIFSWLLHHPQSSVGDVDIQRQRAGSNNSTTNKVLSYPVVNNSTTEDHCSCDGSNANANSTSNPTGIASTFGLHGEVSDCCCTFSTIEQTNLDQVHPLLQRIVSTPFFSHFKIDLCSDCELWEDAPLCMLRDCGVCECDRPPEWATEVEWMPKDAVMGDNDGDCGHVGDQVVTMVDSHVMDSWAMATSSASPMFFEESQPQPTDKEDTAVVVDLRLNPERYTGYTGQSAEKVWSAIHEDNCFQQDDTHDDAGYCTLPTEQRVYNRIISGLHSSISLHIAHSYCLEMDPNKIAECKVWGTNSALAHERVLSHKDRLENLYVVFAVMLRAVQKAGTAITAAVPTDDPFFTESLAEWTDSLQPEITKMMESCPPTFDEKSLFAESGAGDADSKRLELKRKFAHLLQIMKCVGCDRCKLWGTLQTLGVGTALRIILDDEDEMQQQDLSRQEAVALVHTLERFSSALVYARHFAEEL